MRQAMSGAVERTRIIAPAGDLRRSFKDVFSELASGVCVVTFWRDRRLHGFTATSVTSVSLDPLRVLFCVSVSSESFSYLRAGSDVGISILSAEQRALSDRFASKAGLGAYDDIGLVEGAGPAPLIDGALGHITAVVSDRILSGDHAIILCDVNSAQAAGSGSPLLYCRRSYHSLRHNL
jgi:flavin reductase (DIM6/NTAB) family NADH-FMN oxidoreductase RutF